MLPSLTPNLVASGFRGVLRIIQEISQKSWFQFAFWGSSPWGPASVPNVVLQGGWLAGGAPGWLAGCLPGFLAGLAGLAWLALAWLNWPYWLSLGFISLACSTMITMIPIN